MTSLAGELALLVRASNWTCALPIACVEETMRPLAVEALASAPPFVRGIARVRGAPTPVIDLGALIGIRGVGSALRFVTVKVDGRRVAIAVDEVLGLRDLSAFDRDALPPLLREAAHQTVQALGSLDAALLLLLNAGRMVPPAVWEALEKGGAAR